MKNIKNIWVVLLLSLFIGQTAIAEEINNEKMAIQLANPIAALISLPMQLNYDRGFQNTSGNDSNKWTLNIQPVIPISISDEWNLISRTIVPIVRTDNLPLGSGTHTNIGDIVQSAFFSPKTPTESGWIWGAGPVFLIPSGTDLSADTWGVGPTAVALKQDGALTYGILANHIWSTGGDFDISNTFIQPFFTYTTSSAMSLSLTTETTYNWEASESNAWTVPLFMMVTQVGKIGNQLISYGAGVKYYAQSPDGGPQGWGARFVFTMLFPK